MKITVLAPAAWLSCVALLGSATPTPQALHPMLAAGHTASTAIHTDTQTVKPAAAVQWCDSTVATDSVTPGGRQIPMAVCSSTPAESVAMRFMLASSVRALNLYGRLTGLPYPWPRYQLKADPPDGDGGSCGTAGQGMIHCDGTFPHDSRTIHDRPEVTAMVAVHEFFHQWFPEYVGNASSWLTEGFADFMAAQFWGMTQGAQGEAEFLFFYNPIFSAARGKAPNIPGSRSLQTYTSPETYSIPWQGATIWKTALNDEDDSYYRGALVLWMLKQYLGETKFWASVHTYTVDNAHKDVEVGAFQTAVQKTTGEDLEWFFKEWTRGTGYPQFTVNSAYDAAAHRVTLHVTQATPVFRMPVTVRVGTKNGDVLAHAILDSATQTLVVEQVKAPPTFVVFDDGDGIVKTLQFQQPTAWLVAQMQREALPWQTWWAIEQLRDRAAKDPVAAAALITAAQKSHYALTRAQASVALSVVTTPASIATLTQAVRDTSVIVQRGALEGLSGIGTPAALAVIQSVFAHDSSDLVRSHAVQALLLSPGISPTERQTLLAQALTKHAFRNMIQLGAIDAVVTTKSCDAATLSTIRTALANPQLASEVADAIRMGVPTPKASPSGCQLLLAELPPASRLESNTR